MTATTNARIPSHLRRYIVEQNYDRYTPEDQAAWRYILRQLRAYLSKHAHPIYSEGLVKTGISVDRIPKIDDIDAALEKLGWGAVPVSGFIPPAAFMEFQSLGILPIASDIRSLEHMLYTPAPDIVHEAAGHAPILAHKDYSKYLREYGEVATHAIISKEDLDQYEAIRILSDVKEDPTSTPEDIQQAERRLEEVNARIKGVSEAALLSRMNWWTAEYGLIGDLKSPRIFGAGLLSSLGESRSCLGDHVKKIPLSIDCINYSYDITEPQPQLFVTEDFGQLSEVLKQLADQMAFRRGGVFGLKRALEARTVNTVELDSGLQISGHLEEYLTNEKNEPTFLRMSGRCQLARAREELSKHGFQRHAHGYSTPIGPLKSTGRPLHESKEEWSRLGLQVGRTCRLEYASGIVVEGRVKELLEEKSRLLLVTFLDCRVHLGDRLLFDPTWGEFDLGVGGRVVSVFGGPADRTKFDTDEDFVAKRVPLRRYSSREKQRHQLFADIRALRDGQTPDVELYKQTQERYLRDFPEEWLPGVELVEISRKWNLPADNVAPLMSHLEPERFQQPHVRQAIRDGLDLAHV